MRAGAASAAAALLIAGALHAQSMRETVEVHVLELEVAVLDRQGNPVRGLTREDFEVRLGNKPVEITNFFAVDRAAIIETHGEGAIAEAAAVQSSIPTSLFIVIDDTRLGQRAKARIVEALKDYVRESTGINTTVVLARYNGSLHMRTRPSERPGPILAELDAIAKQPAMLRDGERQTLIQWLDESLNGVYFEPDMKARFHYLWREFNAYAERRERQVDSTIDALREVVRLASAFEGRKVVLYASEGLPLTPGIEVFDYWGRASTAMAADAIAEMQALARDVYVSTDSARYDCSKHFRRMVHEAQKGNVLFFAIDAAGVRGTFQGPENAQSIAQLSAMLVRSNEQDGLRFVANETGGRFIGSENDLGRALTVISDQLATWYSLGVRAPSATRLTRVRVTVKGKPLLRVVTARHRRPLTPEEELQRAVRSGLYARREKNPLAADVFVGMPSELDGRCVVPLRISAPRVNGGVTIHFALLDERQQESDVRATSVALEGEGDLAHPISMGLKPGRYVLSIAVVAASGETSFLQRDVIACR